MTTSNETVFEAPVLSGRRKIKTDASVITRDNILTVLNDAMYTHYLNSTEIDYLYKYRKGIQPILERVKDVRPEINYRIVENHADEIVKFKVGYLVGSPIQYVANGNSEEISRGLERLNTYMSSENKAKEDMSIAEWNHICGTAYRMVLPDSEADTEFDDAPFEIFTLDPRYAFVVYGNSLGEPARLGVKYIVREDGTILASCYTPTEYFLIGWLETGEADILEEQINPLGRIPIIEYPLNDARVGAFETVLPLLDAINLTASDRQNGLAQFVQSLMRFHNVKIDLDEFKALRDLGVVEYADIEEGKKAEVDYITSDLNQAGAQSLIEHEYAMVLKIVGMPNRNSGNGDNGIAVVYRDGWSDAETNAKNSETMFRGSELEFLKVVLTICRTLAEPALDLRLRDIKVRFTRRNYENIQMKSQVLVTMLANEKIHPRLAFEYCGMFVDPEQAYIDSMEYYEENKQPAVETEPAAQSADETELEAQNGEDNGNTGEDAENNPAAAEPER